MCISGFGDESKLIALLTALGCRRGIAPSLGEEGCQIYHWSQGADDPTLFLLYMEWRDKACFEAHIATPHVMHAEDRLKREKMLIEPAKEWHFYPL